MKHPIMLVCAMVAAVSTSVLAEGAAAPAAPAAPAAAVNNDAAQKEKAAKLQAAREGQNQQAFGRDQGEGRGPNTKS